MVQPLCLRRCTCERVAGGVSAVAAQVIHQSQLKERFFWKASGYGILVPSGRCHHMEEPADDISPTQKASDAIWALEGDLSVPVAVLAVFASAAFGKARGRLKWCGRGGFKVAWAIFEQKITFVANLSSTLKREIKKNISSLHFCQTRHSWAPPSKCKAFCERYQVKSTTAQYAQMIRCHIGTITVSLFVLWSGGCLFPGSPSSFTVLLTSARCDTTANQCAAEHRWWLPTDFWTAPHILSRIPLSQLFYWLQGGGIMAHLRQKQRQKTHVETSSGKRKGMFLGKQVRC